MLLAWDRGKEILKGSALIFLAAGFAALAAAQAPPKAQVPDTRTVILPQTIVAGAPAMLAVLDSAGRLVPNAKVELSGGQKVTTDATGRAVFVAPGGAGKLTAKIPGQEMPASSTVSVIPNASSESAVEGASGEVKLVTYPHVLTIHDRFTIEGTGFRGAADSNRVFLGDQPCLVMASSPVALVVLPGMHIPIGATTLRVSVAGHDAVPIPVSAVSLEFSGPTETPDAGTQGNIILAAHGSTEPLFVEVRNDSPEIIQFPHGRVQRLTTSGGENNIAPVELRFLAAGNYTITARLIPAESASPPSKN